MLERLLRSLAAYDVVRYAGEGRFTLGHVGRGLVGPGSLNAMVRYANAPWHAAAYAQLGAAVRSGRSGFSLTHDTQPFEFLAHNEEAGRLFDAAMASLTAIHAPPFVAAYDFSTFDRVIDVGGGTGLLLAAILDRFPKVRGTLFELPSAAQRAGELARARGLEGRLHIVEGDILKQSPPPGDAYILSHILHDWDDESCVRMLENVGSAAPQKARVLVYEIVAQPPNNRWSQDRVTDLEMMAMLPGRERTRGEFLKLLARCRLRLHRVIPTAAAESILEALFV